MSVVLGMCLAHDGAVAAVVDGKLRAAIARERLTRVKKDAGVSLEMVAYVLDQVGATLADVTEVAFTSYDYQPNSPIKAIGAHTDEEIRTSIFDIDLKQMYGRCRMLIGQHLKPAVFVHHHLCHCAAAFYTSPFDRAACISMDASMERPEACSVFAYGEGQWVFPFYCPGLMIGNAYHGITEKLGLGHGLFKAGSTMGLAAYGKVLDVARQHWREFGQSYYSRPYLQDDALFINYLWSRLSGTPPHSRFSPEQNDSSLAMEVAASIQYILEETTIDAACRLYEETRNFNDGCLCLGGGSFLNCNANTAIKMRSPFEKVHLFPACGDDGTAAGSALWVAHHLLNQPRSSYRPGEVAYLGRCYPTPAAGAPLDQGYLARLLADGGLVAWYQGGSEFGPRALGNRSLLADPRRPDMRDLINRHIKGREWFRPLAPSVLEDQAADWFDFDGPSPFMLHTSRVKQRDAIPAVTHVDGSARQQTVHAGDNPTFYQLISAFRDLTGVPMLLNTSLNVNGEPLVETPDDALRFFQATKVHALVISDRMILNPSPAYPTSPFRPAEEARTG